MKIQISRSNMLAEEMARFALANLPDRNFTEHRILELNLSFNKKTDARTCTVRLSGIVAVFEPGHTRLGEADIYRFKGEMKLLAQPMDNWKPKHIDFSLLEYAPAGKASDQPLSMFKAECEFTSRKTLGLPQGMYCFAVRIH